MIPRYRTILYATDLSVNAAHAFRHAIGLAQSNDAAIHILHVLPEVDSATVHNVSTVMGEQRLAELELEHKEEVLEMIRESLRRIARDESASDPQQIEYVAAVEVRHGSPAGRILETAERIDADLIVVGSHGKGRLKHVLLGSVAEKVLRKSRRPVLVAPLPD